MKMIKVNISESEFDEMKIAKLHARRIKAKYESYHPTDFISASESVISIPESLWHEIERLLNDENIRSDLNKE